MYRTVQARVFCIVCLFLCSLLLAAGLGCSSSPANSNSAGQYNNYAGTQNVVQTGTNAPAEGGVWSLSLDDVNNFFTYEDEGDYSSVTPSTIGSFTASNGFLDLTINGESKGSGGYAIEIPGSAALLRPGNDTNFPVAAVAASSCPSIQANTTYQFVVLGHPRAGGEDTSAYPAYGSIQATAQGTAWTFSNYSTYTADGTSLNPAALAAGTCSYTQEGYVINVPSTDTQTANVPITVAVGPTGFFMADLGQNGEFNPRGFGLAGMVKPSSQLNTGDVVAGKYIGFQYVPLQGVFDSYLGGAVSLGPVTAPVVFGQIAGSGTTITGGAYPNDDVTQTPPSNITINLGQEDSQNNGLYKSVTVTIPDPSGSCISRSDGGEDANGNPTCIFPGVAVAGNPDNKFVLFVTANDERAAVFGYSPMPIEFLLYQQ